ncbi:MAG TPA: acetylglutamate kinase [Balneolaceae bacterium]|nr:acetylglutamate kinase [Balneolaceae bacterium]
MNFQKYTKQTQPLKGQVILIKFGGNAMINEAAKRGVVKDIVSLKKMGALPVIVHGGGPFIRQILELAEIDSEFVQGHRVTTEKAMQYIEMALSGRVNGEIVALVNKAGGLAVGLSGKDGFMVTAKKRIHKQEGGKIDLGFVGDVGTIRPDPVLSLLEKDYLPVISPISMDENGNTYNINADMFAGHMAGALQAKHYIAMTDVDGILADKEKPASLIARMKLSEAENGIGNLIQGGMIPKVESCLIALRQGVKSTHIINGTASEALLQELLSTERCGTLITR